MKLSVTNKTLHLLMKATIEICLIDIQCQRSRAVLSEHQEMLAKAGLQEVFHNWSQLEKGSRQSGTSVRLDTERERERERGKPQTKGATHTDRKRVL